MRVSFVFGARRGPSAGALLRAAFVLCALMPGAGAEAGAQSGRRQAKPRSPVPVASPAPEQGGVSDSDAGAKRAANEPLHSFYVLEDENTDVFMNIPVAARDIIMESFVARLRASSDVSASSGGRGDRRRARDHAKTERKAYTVLLEITSDQMMGRRPRNAGEPVPLDSMAVNYYVYAPGTATLKAQGRVYMRPAQASARVGGIRLPIPAPTSSRIGVEYVLEQAGRDAAERVASSLDIRLPDR